MSSRSRSFAAAGLSACLWCCVPAGPVSRDRGGERLFSEAAVLLRVPEPGRVASGRLCGLAVAEALCAYWGREIGGESRKTLSGASGGEGGLSPEMLRRELAISGYKAEIFRGRLDRSSSGIYYQIDQRRPVIVWSEGADGCNHYRLVVGYDPQLGLLALLDPVLGQTAISERTFRDFWEASGGLALLAVPDKDSPPPSGRYSTPGARFNRI